MLRRIAILGVAATSLLAITAGIAAGGAGHGPEAKAVLHDADGAKVGVVRFTEHGGDVRVRVEVSGLAAGFHGFHVHAVGECIPPFTSALGHLNPTGASHSAHAGDMPVLLVNADGTGEARFVSDRFGLADITGRAIIVHVGPDNYANIPTRYSASGPDATTLATGDAGGRTACGVIVRGHGD